MAVAADTANLEISPSLEEVRELARDHTLVPLRHTFIDDCETPVSAYLKLRGAGPSFLLESAEQGQRFGRWSFLGVQPRSVIRLADGVMTVDGTPREFDDPYQAVAEELARYKLAELPDLPPFAGGAVGLFGYDLVRWFEPTVGAPNPDDVGIPDLALMVSDVLLAFDHFTHEVTVLANVFADGERSRRALQRGRRRDRRRARAPVGTCSAQPRRPARAADVRGVEPRRRRLRGCGRALQGVHPRGRRLPDRPEPALERGPACRRVLDLPRAARGQPEPVHVFPRLRGLRDRGRIAGGARHRPRPRGEAAPDRGHASARGDRPRRTCMSPRTSSRTRRSARST